LNWLLIATLAYFLIALEVILDKFLLSSEKVSHPAIYAFYSGVMSAFTFFFFPFGLHRVSFLELIPKIFSGVIFIYGILSLFYAIKKSEASRVTPVVGAVIPMFTLFLSAIFLGERLKGMEIAGILFLVCGGLMISLDLSKIGQKKFFGGFQTAVLSGALLALAFTLFKEFYNHDNFFNVFIWTRLGLVVGAFSLLANSTWRKAILGSLINFKKPKKENQRSGVLFVLNKILGGTGSIILNYSIKIGNVTVINALVALEYTFIFLAGLIFSSFLPNIFYEKKDIRNLTQKVISIAIITLGIILVSRSPLH
jgi:drug/metabolite transporter (DMT)-like permease